MRTIDEIIKEHPFFKGLDQKYIELIAGCGFNAKYEAGDVICQEGEQARHFYMIRQGMVSIEIIGPGGKTMVVRSLEPGNIVGYSWLIPPYKYKFVNRVMEPSTLTVFDGNVIRSMCEKDPKMGYELLKRVTQVVVERLNNSRSQFFDLYGRNTF
ncbi:MAG: cyclic nucleotide-binding domain-containing protein [Elusimicrobia bacterium]|nr:cyclic nucleotide-binding domain-containing protein [Elusimicrobiota bacterium]